MENEEIKKLEEELAQKLKEASEISKLRLDQNRSLIDQKLKDIIDTYSNDIRNISIILEPSPILS